MLFTGVQRSPPRNGCSVDTFTCPCLFDFKLGVNILCNLSHYCFKRNFIISILMCTINSNLGTVSP